MVQVDCTSTLEPATAVCTVELLIAFPDAAADEVVTDDDSSGGIFGLNSQIIYQAPKDGEYFISVSDSAGFDVGGYALTVSVAPPGLSPLLYLTHQPHRKRFRPDGTLRERSVFVLYTAPNGVGITKCGPP